MKRLIALLFAITFAIAATQSFAWEKTPDSALTDEQVKEVRIDGAIDEGTLKSVREWVTEVQKKDSKIKVLRIGITSPGGEAVSGLASARMLRQLSDKGQVKVEVNAFGLCASACTWILASGTPGSRTIDRYTLTLVHPLQRGGGFGPMICVEHKEKTKDQSDKILNSMLELGRDLYMKFTGQPKEVVEKWLSCGHEIVGFGQSLVDLRIADRVVD